MIIISCIVSAIIGAFIGSFITGMLLSKPHPKSAKVDFSQVRASSKKLGESAEKLDELINKRENDPARIWRDQGFQEWRFSREAKPKD